MVIMMQERFKMIEDPRHQSYVTHRLSDILIIVMCAVLCGLDELSTIMTYAQNKASMFKDEFGIEAIPSKPTMSRVLGMIDGEAIAKVIIGIMKDTASKVGEVIAVDGKAIRSTSKTAQPHSALQIITAYLTESSVVLGQEKINEKTNEIPVFQEMLSYIDVNGKTITADALHCQRETCAKIIEKHGDYVFGLKDNQKTLHDDVELFFCDAVNKKEFETYTTQEKNGGRIEKRVCRKLANLDWLESKAAWRGLKTVFAVTRTVTAKGFVTEETSYYISSLNVSAEKLLNISREHWKIESLHWMLDVVFSEDSCRLETENAHITLNLFRKLAVLLHRQFIAQSKKKVSVRTNMLNCLITDSVLFDVFCCSNL